MSEKDDNIEKGKSVKMIALDAQEDELILEDIDEETNPLKPANQPKLSKEMLETPMPSKLKTAWILGQRLVFLIVWILIAYLSLSFKNLYDDYKGFVGVPANTYQDYKLENFVGLHHLGLNLEGPFDQGTKDDNDETKYLTVSMIQIGAENAPTHVQKLSADWKVKLEKDIEKADLSTEQHLFELHNLLENKPIYMRCSTNTGKIFTIKADVTYTPMIKKHGIIIGAFLLLFLYTLIVFEIIDRTFAAMLASSLSLAALNALGTFPTISELMGWVDVETILLLFGMMILVGILSESGLFDYMTVFAYQITKGRIWPLINTLCFFTALCSTFMDNVTMMLLITPVTIRLCEITELSPVPILMCMVFYSNVGAAMTPVGDPPNVIITTNRYISSQGMDFLTFFSHMFPGVMLTIVQTYLQLRYLHYRKINKLKIQKPPNQQELEQEMEAWYRAADTIEPISKDETIVQQTLMHKGDDLKSKLEKTTPEVSGRPHNFEEVLAELRANYYIRDVPLLIKSLVAFGFAAFLFCVHSLPVFHNVTLDWAALLCALLLLVIGDIRHLGALLRRVEWSTLLFFASLFILMEALAKMGLIELIGNVVMSLILMAEPEHRLTCAILIILWVSAIASAFLDNIPVATMMVKIVIQVSQNTTLNLPLLPLCWALALGACFGGNGTLIGASANVVAAGVAQQHGHKFTFVGFFLVGFPLMIGNTIVATIYLLFAHMLFSWH